MTPQQEEIWKTWVYYRDTLRREREDERRKRQQREEEERMLEEIKNLKEALEKNEERGRRLEVLIMQQEEAETKVDSQEDKQTEEHVETKDQVDGEELVTRLDQVNKSRGELMSEVENIKSEEDIQAELKHNVAANSLQHEGKMGQTVNNVTKNTNENSKEEDHLMIQIVKGVEKTSIYEEVRNIALGEAKFFSAIGKQDWITHRM